MPGGSRSITLFFFGAMQRLVKLALSLAVLGFLVRFGLTFSHASKLDSAWLIVRLRQLADPLIAEVGSWFNLSWPSSASPEKYLPLGLAIGVWIVLASVNQTLLKGRRLLEESLPGGRASEPSRPMVGASLHRSGSQPAPTAAPAAPELDSSPDSAKGREQLLKQLREIEKALKTAKRKCCAFLSIDVVGSTQMKGGESATAIAASFQAYEEMLRKIFEQHGAWKQAWTPDGVMVCFLQRDLAVGAAHRVLRSLKNFNESENQLRTPFRVRCGLNEGDVAIYEDSQLEKVADPAIDIAGHMQKHCSENALWLGEAFYDTLVGKSGFRPTSHIVDGLKVYEWSLEPPREEAVPAVTVAQPGALSTVAATLSPERTVMATPPAASSTLRIGRYEILQELGRGAMGAVYKARDPQIDRTVALKVILTGNLSDQDLQLYKQRFYREAQAAGKMSHAGIITVYDVAEDVSGQPYLVMEFVEGTTLDHLLAPPGSATGSERPPLGQLLDVGVQVAEALDYAHRRGVIHRDIKPANILVTSEGKAKIADFGIAKLAGSQLTQVGQLMGTPAFMSPEQWTGSAVDSRSDLFSLGAVLYWMFTGEKPFSGDTVTAISFKVVQGTPIPARQLNPALPAAIDNILSRCLAKNPEERYPTGKELAADLDAVKAGRPLAAASPA